MDKQRRTFLTWLSALLPAVAVGSHIQNASGSNLVTESSTEDFWDMLARLKTLPAHILLPEAAKFKGKAIELKGFLSDASSSSANQHKYLLSRKSISCCVDCNIFGPEPFVLINTRSNVASNTKQVTVKGYLDLIENRTPALYLQMDKAQII